MIQETRVADRRHATIPSLIVRSLALAASLSLVLGCGDAAPLGGRRTASAHDDRQVSAPRVDRPLAVPKEATAAPGSADRDAPITVADEPPRSEPVGHLEQPHRLRHLFEALALLEDGHAHEDVRIVEYGDSHIASDLGTGAMRRALQQRFGDGGRGFVALGKPWTRWPYTQDGIKSGATPEFEPDRGKHTRAGFVGDGCYGLLGVALRSEKPGRAWTESTIPSSRVEIDYFEQPNGGSFDVFIDKARVARVDTSASKAASAWRSFDVPDAPHEIEVRSAGNGEVRIFGAILDRATAGVQLDALGIGGAQISAPLSWNEAHFAEQLGHRAPDLYVLAYGTNESLSDTPAAEYERRLAELLGRFVRAAPGASCLLIGPIDRAARDKSGRWKSAPKVEEIVASQRRVAEAAGCAFFDQLAAMGGPGTIDGWAQEKPARARTDRVHLTRIGYEQLAGALVADLLRAYDIWRADNGLAAMEPPPVAAVAPRAAAATEDAPPPHPRRQRARR